MPARTAPAVVEQNSEVTEMSVSFGKEVKAEDYAPITDSKQVKRFVTDYFKDIPILAEIAACESHYRQFDSNGKVLRGQKNQYDVGVMQINELYHLEASEKLDVDIYTLDGNVAYARYLYEKQGAKPWMSSSACWAKPSKSEIAKK
jgi:hypothetical protein